ncbi:DUF3536 domain-containing protein [Anaerohalosphaera lusitana]|nr:DUF3536 domain-containing protein [Anaerohalosphaera lusitana]
MTKYICIHGHFYQPPRENPWLEDVEMQDSAHPHHDWNERITEECYRQNAASRILGNDRKVVDIVNNYENMSFNFGPTLLSWLEEKAPDVYGRILEADKNSVKKFSGHGSAIAQAYNHMILPLANDRDRQTQVQWGIYDFKSRFNREPEGMWLPETAVDTPTLETLVDNGIKFTILAPRQAKKVRPLGEEEWEEVNDSTLDTTVPYTCKLPSGREIAIFFYNGPASHDIAYGGLLHSGENLANRLTNSFPEENEQCKIVHIATDGESFGHHHRHGDMALAYCFHHISHHDDAELTIYAEFLDKCPPRHEVEIWEDSSWSCVHGVERWRSNCGCAGDQSKSGQQQWREPLRNALDWLRDSMNKIYEQRMSEFTSDPWSVRGDYISVILDRSPENITSFIEDHTNQELTDDDKVTFMKLLEMQRNAMLMYTSCGWFFDHIGGIETVQIMQYAARCIQLCHEISGEDLEAEFMKFLEDAPSNEDLFENGSEVYEQYVKPSKIDLVRVGAHFALSSVFEEEEKGEFPVFCYSAKIKDFSRIEAGIQVLSVGRIHIKSQITLETTDLDMIGLYLGGQNLLATVGPRMGGKRFQQTTDKLIKTFHRGENVEVFRLMNVWPEGRNYSLKHLFKDEQRRIVNEILATTFDEIENSFRHIYEYHFAIMQMLRNMNMPLPTSLAAPAAFIINTDIIRELQQDQIDIKWLKNLVDQSKRLSLKLQDEVLGFETSRKINRLMDDFRENPDNIEDLKLTTELLAALKPTTGSIDLQNPQNIFFEQVRTTYPEMQEKAEKGDENAKQWVESFTKLAQHLELSLP